MLGQGLVYGIRSVGTGLPVVVLEQGKRSAVSGSSAVLTNIFVTAPVAEATSGCGAWSPPPRRSGDSPLLLV